jgi:protein-S-isoprenylcysteine O-methyltransferase Ste14
MKPAALRALDLVERALGVGLYAWLTVRIVAGYRAHGGAASLFILPSEGLVLLFLLIRRRAHALSLRPNDWALALTATAAPMLVATGIGRPIVPPVVAAVVMLTGTIVQLHAKLTLGRSFGCVAAHRGLQLDGPYRFVRHPMYAGYLVGHLGFLLVNPTAWNAIVYAACYALQVPRLLAEERLLAQDARYAAYLARVRWHLVPGIY